MSGGLRRPGLLRCGVSINFCTERLEVMGNLTSVRSELEELDRWPDSLALAGLEQLFLVQRFGDVDWVDTCPRHNTAETSGDYDSVGACGFAAACVGQELLSAFVRHEIDRSANCVASEVEAVSGIKTRDSTLAYQTTGCVQ